jgi:hypothetical protein
VTPTAADAPAQGVADIEHSPGRIAVVFKPQGDKDDASDQGGRQQHIDQGGGDTDLLTPSHQVTN